MVEFLQLVHSNERQSGGGVGIGYRLLVLARTKAKAALGRAGAGPQHMPHAHDDFVVWLGERDLTVVVDENIRR
jgi:hypothetical protein